MRSSPFPDAEVHRPLAAALRGRFGGARVRKIALDAGFTCPNIDGTVARGGCVFCSNASFHPGPIPDRRPVAEQLRAGIERERSRKRPRPAEVFLAYFQTFTNTHAPIERLERLWDEALSVEGVAGLVVGTRPDCLPEPVLARLEAIAATGRFVALEIGLESADDATLAFVNRGHDVACFVDAVRRAAGRGLDLSAHVIFGFPGDVDARVASTADLLAALPLDGLKLHHLHVVRGTALEGMHARGEFAPPARADYVRWIAGFIERVPSSFAIHRLVATTPARFLVAPEWTLDAPAVAREILAALAARGSWQGRLVSDRAPATRDRAACSGP